MKEEEEIKKEDDDVEMEIGEILEHKWVFFSVFVF